MNRFSSTAYSSADLESLWRKLPPEAARMTFEIADRAQRHLDAMAHVRAARTEKIEAGIMDCYAHHRRYFEQYPFRQHAQKLRDKLEDEYSLFDLTYPPSLRVIRRTLRKHYS